MAKFKLAIAFTPLLVGLAGCQTTDAAKPKAVAELSVPDKAVIVTGNIGYRERIMTPPGAVLRVSVIDAAIADKSAPEIHRVEYPVGSRGGPFNYILGLSARDLTPSGRYMVRAVIVGPDQRLLWTSDAAYQVDPALKVQTVGPISLVMVAAPPADLTGTWHVTSVSGMAMTDNNAPSITFDGHGNVSGSTGCNNFSGTYTLSGQNITFGPLATTRRACIGAGAANEQAFLAAIGQVTAFDNTDDGGRRLMGAGNVAIMLKP